MPIYDPKLAAGNPQIGHRPMLTRQDLEAAKARNNFDRESRSLQKLNESNAQFWSEQDEKAKR
ncbi:hypothetical protein DBN00_12310 [Salmonella enterica subsp. enterica serovar Nijmegen]|nr:hypothetical protein [Salmonella enterica subsp. enterica serovar Nijmegen]EIV7399283.1 hypothetical protein [Salmonella enterica subsp. enterica serovar Waycross]HCB5683115.1 hypothetical protein [Salmonella enterica subsp. enterica serovar Wien]EDS4505181.1 hypothetical protein [Salmonella enterica subsp. enterica serovar Nijmegen]EDS4840668.1 hypothetical protein [Salmonella enterica subsp. enterica serovar Nijmegen]